MKRTIGCGMGCFLVLVLAFSLYRATCCRMMPPGPASEEESCESGRGVSRGIPDILRRDSARDASTDSGHSQGELNCGVSELLEEASKRDARKLWGAEKEKEVLTLLEKVRSNACPGRKELLDKVIEFCGTGLVSERDRAYVFTERLTYYVQEGRYAPDLAALAAHAYSWMKEYDKAIGVLSDAIDAIKSGKYRLEPYLLTNLDNPVTRQAAIRDFERRIKEVETLKAEVGKGMPSEDFERLVREDLQRVEEMKQARSKHESVDRQANDTSVRSSGGSDREKLAESLFAESIPRSPAEAIEILNRLLDEFPDTMVAPNALYQKALAYEEMHDIKEYHNCLEEYLRQYPEGDHAVEAKYEIAIAAIAEGHEAEALSLLDEIHKDGLRRGVVSLVVVWQIVELQRSRGELDKAISVLEDTIAAIEAHTASVYGQMRKLTEFEADVSTEALRENLRAIKSKSTSRN